MKLEFIKTALQFLAISLLLIGCVQDSEKTILIKNASIIDGSGTPPFRASVRIRNDKIADIGGLKPLASDSVIDARGLILSPGFIDSHSHHDRDTLRTMDAAISQGITTIIVGQDGYSQWPLGSVFDSLNNTPLSVNLGSYAGHGKIRILVMGDDYKRKASSVEIDSMKSLLKQAMEAGALGLSTGLEYDPGIYSTTGEVIELAKVTSSYNGTYISHLRSEDVGLEKSIEEIIRIGQEAQIPVQISHFKLARRSLWKQAGKILKMLDSARTAGINITADIYPYEYWQSTMRVLFPQRDFDNRTSAEFALNELTSPEGMIISRFNAEPSYEGKTLDEIAKERNEEPAVTYMELIRMSEEIPGESIIAKSMDSDDIRTILQWPFTNLCSDGAPSGHPRGWGAFPKYLAMKTGDRLPEKIKKMTSQAATNLRLDSIGVIKKGYYADLVLFDRDNVKDNATYEKSNLRATGIKLVMVSGKVVYYDQKPTGIFSGRIIDRKE